MQTTAAEYRREADIKRQIAERKVRSVADIAFVCVGWVVGSVHCAVEWLVCLMIVMIMIMIMIALKGAV